MSGLWIDNDDALPRLESLEAPAFIKEATENLIDKGLVVLRGVNSHEACEAVVNDYNAYLFENADYVKENLDENGREKRLVDFHHTSPSCLALGNNAAVLALLDFVFGSESGIYTSLTFKYGTQQPVHRDVPHFATFPKNRFMGVWHALERVTVNNGPLFYYPGGHKFPLSAHDALTETQENYPNLAGEDLFEAALDIYNGMVIDHCEKLLLMEVIELDPGDVVIWHPQLPHGGMPIKSNDTRFSTVFHCAPIDTQVYQYKTFFEYASAVVKPPNRYDFKTIGDRKYAVAGSTLFM